MIIRNARFHSPVDFGDGRLKNKFKQWKLRIAVGIVTGISNPICNTYSVWSKPILDLVNLFLEDPFVIGMAIQFWTAPKCQGDFSRKQMYRNQRIWAGQGKWA